MSCSLTSRHLCAVWPAGTSPCRSHRPWRLPSCRWRSTLRQRSGTSCPRTTHDPKRSKTVEAIVMPALGQTSEEAYIQEWLVKEGDEVEMGQPLLSVET